MANINTQKCDAEKCSIQKNEDSTGWWKVFLIRDDAKVVGVVMLKWNAAPIGDTVMSPRAEIYDPAHADAHLCGDNHLIDWVSKKGISIP